MFKNHFSINITNAGGEGAIANVFSTLTVEANTDKLIAASNTVVPVAVWLFGSGLLGMVGVARRKVRG